MSLAQKRRLGSADASADFLLPAPASFGKTGGFKSGVVGRKLAPGLGNGSLVGIGSGTDEVTRPVLVQPDVHRASGSMEAGPGGHGASTTPCSAVPAEAFRTKSRSMPSSSHCPGD